MLWVDGSSLPAAIALFFTEHLICAMKLTRLVSLTLKRILWARGDDNPSFKDGKFREVTISWNGSCILIPAAGLQHLCLAILAQFILHLVGQLFKVLPFVTPLPPAPPPLNLLPSSVYMAPIGRVRLHFVNGGSSNSVSYHRAKVFLPVIFPVVTNPVESLSLSRKNSNRGNCSI